MGTHVGLQHRSLALAGQNRLVRLCWGRHGRWHRPKEKKQDRARLKHLARGLEAAQQSETQSRGSIGGQGGAGGVAAQRGNGLSGQDWLGWRLAIQRRRVSVGTARLAPSLFPCPVGLSRPGHSRCCAGRPQSSPSSRFRQSSDANHGQQSGASCPRHWRW